MKMPVSNDLIEYHFSYNNGYTSTYDYAVYDIIIVYNEDESENEHSTTNNSQTEYIIEA